MASMQAVTESFRVLNIAYPQHYRHLDEKNVLLLLKFWEHDFRRFSDDTLKKAVIDARRECRYFPTIAELIDHCRTYEDGYDNLGDIVRERDAGEAKPNDWDTYAYAAENPAP